MRVTAGGTVLVLAALFGVGGARAAGLCPSTLGAAARLEDVPPEVRLEWIDARLGEGRRTSRIWVWSWGVGIAASGVASLAVVPFVARGDRVDWYTSAVSAAFGVIPLALAPPAVIRDARVLHERREEAEAAAAAHPGASGRGPGSDGVCALLADAEARLSRDAEDQRRQQSWWLHAGNVVFNTGVALFLGLGFHHWTSGLINGGAGLVVGEALILTQPTRTIDDLRRYRAGELASTTDSGAPTALALTYRGRF